IAMYQVFLAQDNLPDNVRAAFEYLVNASQNHLNAFSNDHYAYYGEDMMNQIKNQFKKMFKGSSQNNGSGSGNGPSYSNAQGALGGYDGVCPNA
ncbi:MAG TPA: hypothetical protein PKU69_01965, partial [Bacillota bacterium]|nr:hypothetical protein [Bacillota bacterium]